MEIRILQKKYPLPTHLPENLVEFCRPTNKTPSPTQQGNSTSRVFVDRPTSAAAFQERSNSAQFSTPRKHVDTYGSESDPDDKDYEDEGEDSEECEDEGPNESEEEEIPLSDAEIAENVGLSGNGTITNNTTLNLYFQIKKYVTI